MNTKPLFSIIIPTFNRKNFLRKAIDSVLSQTFQDFELNIIDDGSKDGTDTLISGYSDKRIKYYFQENTGVSSSRNKGLQRSAGRHIAFLDSDDWWENTKLEKTLEYIKKYPDIYIFHTNEIWYRQGKILQQKKKHKKPTGLVYRYALPLCCISISTAVIHKSVFKEIGLFDESFDACEDYDFWLRATSKFEVKLIPENLTLKDGGRKDQLSYSTWGLDRFRIKALEKMLASNALSKEDRLMTLEELNRKCTVFSQGAHKRGKKEESEYYKNLPLKYRI